MKSITTFIPSILLASSFGVLGAAESDYYTIDTFDTENTPMEVSGMMTYGANDLMVATRLGDIYIARNVYGDPADVEFHHWARGLAQPLGLLEFEGWIYFAQRGELTLCEGR